jgi:hypothetical protein
LISGGCPAELGRQTPRRESSALATLWRIEQQPDGAITFSTNAEAPLRSRPLTADWRHIAAVRDASQLRLYIDGVPVAEATLPTATPPTSSAKVQVGAQGQSCGAVGALRLWDRALSADDVAYNMAHQMLGDEQGLLAAYDFTDQSGMTAPDSSPNARHATLTGAFGWVGDSAVTLRQRPVCVGLTNGALRSTKQITWPTESFSMEGWVKFNGSAEPQTIFTCGSGASRVALSAPTVTTLRFSHGDGLNLDLTHQAPAGTWLHVAVSYNSLQKFVTLSALYMNDNEVAQQQHEIRNDVEPISFGGELFFGRNSDGTHPLQGKMSDLRFWQMALTVDQIRARCTMRLRGSEDGLYAYWPLDENGRAYCRDHGFNHFHLLLLDSADMVRLNPIAFTNTSNSQTLPSKTQANLAQSDLSAFGRKGNLPHSAAVSSIAPPGAGAATDKHGDGQDGREDVERSKKLAVPSTMRRVPSNSGLPSRSGSRIYSARSAWAAR